MTIDDQIRDEKLQYDINREAAKISALSSGKLHKYEYLTGEDILPSNQQQIIEQAKFTYSPLGKAFEKQIKTIEDQGKKQVDALKEKQVKATEDKSVDKNNQSTSAKIFNDLIEKTKNIMNELHDDIDLYKLHFKYEVPTKDINLNQYYDSKELFNGTNILSIKFDNAVKKQRVVK